MLIDWFTVIAQVVNFLILVWLMKRFLYTPILDAIDAREQRIAAGLANALTTQAEAERRLDEYNEKNEAFERQRKALFNTATLEAQVERQRLLAAARKAHEELRLRQQEAMNNDFLNRKDEIMRRTREEVFAITRKTLADLAAESLERRMVETFIRRCRTLDEGERKGLQTAFVAAAGPGLVRSTFSLPAEQQQELAQAIRKTFGFTGQIQFETSPDLVSGIALSINGYEVSWTIADYLPALEERVAEILCAATSGESQPAGQSKPQIDRGGDGHG